jgi:hypothetical protein
VKITSFVPPFLTWHLSHLIIIDVLSLVVSALVVSACVLNQSYGHWLTSNVLHAIINMTLKLKEEYGIAFSMNNLMEDGLGVVLELSMSTYNIKYEQRKLYNILSLMLDPRFKPNCFFLLLVKNKVFPL